LPNVENSPKTKEKKMPHSSKQESKKCRDVDLEVWWKLGGICTNLVSESKSGGPNFQ
jgi:hypothetical protein